MRRSSPGLAGAEKDRAENLMIVDLLRNDISRLARIGSVKVPGLFAVERYATVHQMVTSTVKADLVGPPGSRPADAGAVFPAGRSPGAPKIRAMEIIREVEPARAGSIAGAIGLDGAGWRSRFSTWRSAPLAVARAGIVMNVGGGLTHGSTVDGEWEEALWKARFVKAAVTPRGSLIETLLWDGGGDRRLALHLARLAPAPQRRTSAMGLRSDVALRRWSPMRGAGPPAAPDAGRVWGEACEPFPLPPAKPDWRRALPPKRLASGDPWLAVKSTNRPLYDAPRRPARWAGRE